MGQNILIIGANGLVGTELAKQLPDAHAFTRSECDILDTAALEKIFLKYKPQAIFNCAAMTNVDLCETERNSAYEINAVAVGNLAKLCKSHSTTLIHFSTDYIFDGTGDVPMSESHSPHPMSIYGDSKLKGEDAVKSNCKDWIIARVQLVFGGARNNFIFDTAKKLLAAQEVRAFSDQVGAPTYSVDIARMSIALYNGGHRGIFNVVNSGYASRVDAAHEIAQQLNIQTPSITPVLLKELKLPAERPLNCRLSVDKIRHLGIIPPSWQDAISRFLHEAKFL